jgi:uncharacterized membrane protein
MIFFASLGVTTEVIFTAFSDLLNNEPLCGTARFSLAGSSYVWMVFIYALIPLFGHFIYERIKHYPLLSRLLLYLALVYLIEFTSGFLLQQLTGRCPWQYTSGWHIMGLIRLDYAPAWLVFCFILERLYIFINKKVIQ